MKRNHIAVAAGAFIVTVVAAIFLVWTLESNDGKASLEQSVLRLTDLTEGYTLGDDRGCGVIGREGISPVLEVALGQTFPPFCTTQFERPVHHSPYAIESTAIELSSMNLAAEVMTAVPELSRWVHGTDESLVVEPFDFGDEAALLRFADINTGRPGVLLAWRDGTRVNMVAVTGAKEPDLMGYAQELASIQQQRSHNPEPVRLDDLDDRKVYLDRAEAAGPLYWLGDRFEPQDMPDLVLSSSAGPFAKGGGPGNRAKLDYDPIAITPSWLPRMAPSIGVRLTIWDVEAWEAFSRSELGDFATSPPCVEPRVIQLPDRRIEIHPPNPRTPPPLATPSIGGASSEQRDPLLPPDPDGPNQCPTTYVGHIYFDNAVVAINAPICFSCTGPGGAYDSEEGIEAVGRALRKR